MNTEEEEVARKSRRRRTCSKSVKSSEEEHGEDKAAASTRGDSKINSDPELHHHKYGPVSVGHPNIQEQGHASVKLTGKNAGGSRYAPGDVGLFRDFASGDGGETLGGVEGKT